MLLQALSWKVMKNLKQPIKISKKLSFQRNEGNTYFGYTNQYHPARIESDTILSGRILTSWDTIENGTYIVRKKA